MTSTLFHTMPITFVMKSREQKVYRQLHCNYCGWPIAEITDNIVIVFDGNTPIERLEPSRMGIVDLRCHRSECKQYYRLEFAV